MFTGPLAEKSDVSVPEIEPNDFKTFLLYLYTDSTTVDADNVTTLLYASRKYAITAFESQCTEFLGKNLNVDNACVVLNAAHRFDQKLLFQKALTLIMKNGVRSLQSAGFLALSQELVDQIVESDDFVVEEHHIFDAVNSWAEAECGRQGREVTPEAKRTVLGMTLLKVRFPLLKHKFMAKDVKYSGLLTESERLSIFEHIGCPENDVKPFNNKPRLQTTSLGTTHTITRFLRESSFSWSVIGQMKDAISFQSNSDLILCGYRLYGPKRDSAPTTYTVTTYFGNEENVLQTVIQDATEYNVNSKVFDVPFKTPVDMKAGVWYTLAVLIKGGRTLNGENGNEVLLCPDGVKFTFRESQHSANGTSIEDGQIPSLLYRIANDEVVL